MKTQIVDTTDKNLSKEERVIKQALARYSDAAIAEEENWSEAIDDLLMLAGKNHWPEDVQREREEEGRPTLVINKLPGFADRIVNETRLNQIGVKVKPASGNASPQIADIYNGIIKSIERDSSAQVARQTALEGAVYSGFGYYRIITKYTDETTFDQEISIVRIKNNFSVLLDPSRVRHDGEDGRYGFITEMISVDEYEARYPGKKVPTEFPANLPVPDDARWVSEKSVRVAEYWVKEPKKKTLLLLSDGRTVDAEDWEEVLPELEAQQQIVHVVPDPATGQPVMIEGPAPEGSGYQEEVINPVPTILRQREVESHVVMQYFMDSEKLLCDPVEWPGRYIPIIEVRGKEINIGDKTQLRGAIRFAKDSQRMYDYFRTAATETVAFAPKAPYVIADAQVEGYEDEWDDANRANRARLTYKYVPGLMPPQRQVVTQTAIGEITEANIASDEMKATTSVYDASLGLAGNEVSGAAISRRQSQSDVTNFTFSDNLRLAIEYEGKILVDLIPRIYDTERQVVIIKPDDEQETITVNQEVVMSASGKKVIVNDLTLGKYSVTTTAGPSFNTLRDEAAASMMDFVRTAPETATMILDLIVEAQNWPNAVKVANRLKKMLPPGIDDQGPPPPPQQSIQDVIDELKAQQLKLGNDYKKLEIVEKRAELTDEARKLKDAVEIMSKIQQIKKGEKEGSDE